MKNSLNNEILKYFLIFSLLILSLLWLFQFLFFNYFYREQKINDIKTVASKIKSTSSSRDFKDIVNNLAFDKSVCIEIIGNNYNSLYHSTYFGKGCLTDRKSTSNYKVDFISNNYKEKTYELINEEFKNKSLVHAIKLENNNYAFINTSLDSVDGTVFLIRKELILITIIVLITSFILAYFISNHIANPIKDINKKANQLAKGNFNVEFDSSNILEIKELSNTLNYAKEELNKTEELRRDLMANISHDLKTPLTMIKAYAEIAIDLHINNTEKQKEDMETIISEADRLTLLVNDILSLSKMETLNAELNIEEFDLIKLINDILKKYQVLQETEKYLFNFKHKDKSLLINADKSKLTQVIYNLINNAINYTGDDNSVTINITNYQNNILVEIIDTGKGIKKEDIPYIWNKYYKNKKKHKRNLIGTGLGLSIVKNILESHKFKYGVKSKKDKGSNFYFEIPKEM